MATITYNQLQYLFFDPFNEKSPLKLKPLSDKQLAQIPVLQQILALAKIVQSHGKITLTKTGNLPVAIVKELYAAGPLKNYFIEEGIDKLYSEEKCEEIHLTHIISKKIPLFTKKHKTIHLSSKGKKLIEDKNQLLKAILVTFSTKFNLGYFDAYSSDSLGIFGIVYTLFLLDAYGDKKQSLEFYYLHYMKAFKEFEHVLKEPIVDMTDDSHESCYASRSFSRCFNYFGFIDIETTGFMNISTIKKNKLLNALFEFQYHLPEDQLN